MAAQTITRPLLVAAAATGSTVTVETPGDWCFSVAGTFGGATIGLQKLGPDGTTWISLKDSAGAIALTSADALVVSLAAGSYRATVTGGTGVSVSASLEWVG